jgi:glycosyltransferase involved in cell wall biosynthesis
MQVALVLWDGNVGGAEIFTARLAGALRGLGIDASIVFVRDPAQLGAALDELGVPYVSLGATRIEEVLWRPRQFAAAVAEHGADGALLPAVGHQALALRIGGYRAPLVAMEHGYLMLIEAMSGPWKTARRVERAVGARFVDAEVAVSNPMRERVLRVSHGRRVEVIENGVDVARFPYEDPAGREGVVFGFASRLIPGKGIPELLEAFGRVLREVPPARMRIAGQGPEREATAATIERLGLTNAVELSGVVHDMPGFWREVQVAVMPSTAPESFGMSALEAMATGRPVVATRNGGADDLVEDGVTGRLVPCGDAEALAGAMLFYARDDDLRRVHGQAGRERCEERYTLERCAARYAGLVAELGGHAHPGPAPVEAPLEEVHA